MGIKRDDKKVDYLLITGRGKNKLVTRLRNISEVAQQMSLGGGDWEKRKAQE